MTRVVEGLFMIGGWAFAIAATALAAVAYPDLPWLVPIPISLALAASVHCFVRRFEAEREMRNNNAAD